MQLDPEATPTDDALEPDLDPAGGASRRRDRVSILLTAATLAFVAGALWLRMRVPAAQEPPTVGSTPPPLQLLNLETSEPLYLLGLKGKVTWIVFWSADAASGRAVLPPLEDAWRKLRSHRRFALVAVAVDSEVPERARQALAAVHAGLPAYLATPETRQRYGVVSGDPPLHLLIDVDGRIAALVRGAGKGTIHRLSAQVRGWLDDLDPLGPTRFAGVPAATPGPAVAIGSELDL